MTTRYVGQDVDGLWAANTGSAKYPDSDLDEFGYANLTAALNAANTNDTIYLQPGTYTLPEITIPLTIKGQDRTAVNVSGGPISADNVILDSINVTDTISVSGSAAFVRCNSTLDPFAIATNEACAVAAGCQNTIAAESIKAAATNYPFIRPSLGGSGRYSKRYRVWATVQAPATRRQRSGESKIARWISLGRMLMRMEESSAREAIQARLLIVNATGRCFTKSGFPISNEFRLQLADGRNLEVRSAAYLDPPDSELEIMYSEVGKG